MCQSGSIDWIHVATSENTNPKSQMQRSLRVLSMFSMLLSVDQPRAHRPQNAMIHQSYRSFLTDAADQIEPHI
jgi:hypothetical protein